MESATIKGLATRLYFWTRRESVGFDEQLKVNVETSRRAGLESVCSLGHDGLNHTPIAPSISSLDHAYH